METTPFSQEAVPPSPPPPPTFTPPPVIAPPSPPKPRKSRGWMIFAIILLVLLFISLFGNLTQFVSRMLTFNNSYGFRPTMARDISPKLEECLLKDNDARNKIAVVEVDGIISGQTADPAGNSMVDVIKAQFNRAKEDSRVKAVILKVDSPGGEVMASDQINRVIADFQDKSGKPVICSMGSLAASGGYYISVPCRWIQANQLTLTGSIGVIMEGLNYRGLMDKIGLAPMVYKSGKYKDMLSGMRSTNEIPTGEQAMVQGLIDETYATFTNVVYAGRTQAHQKNGNEGKALAGNWTSFVDGRVLSGKQALDLGFVDQLGDFDDAVKTAKRIANIQDGANLVEYRERYDLSNFLSMFGQSSQSHDIKLDMGLNIPKLQAGALYFLWQAPGN
jgi:protease-4